MRPKFFACCSIYGHKGAMLSGEICDVIDDNRAEGVANVIVIHIGPGDLELLDVTRVQLLQRGIVRAVRTAEIVPPCGVGLLGRGVDEQRERSAG